jgi:predicted GTPase
MENYGSQVQVDLPMNILALHTLENILRLADNTLECQAGALPVDAEPQPVIELMSTPWRNEDKMSEEEVNKLWTELSDIPLDRVDRLRICVIGPSGAGKSAYINSCMSEFYQRIVTFAETGCGNSPNTTSYREYALKQGREGPVLDVELMDTMGIMEGNGGILTEDITTVLDGKAENTCSLGTDHE